MRVFYFVSRKTLIDYSVVTTLMLLAPPAHCLRGMSVAFLLRVSCMVAVFSMSLHTRNMSDAALLALSVHMYVPL